ncbi:uncharacterized protein PHA67_002701 [Liasis olivaceus]
MGIGFPVYNINLQINSSHKFKRALKLQTCSFTGSATKSRTLPGRATGRGAACVRGARAHAHTGRPSLAQEPRLAPAAGRAGGVAGGVAENGRGRGRGGLSGGGEERTRARPRTKQRGWERACAGAAPPLVACRTRARTRGWRGARRPASPLTERRGGGGTGGARGGAPWPAGARSGKPRAGGRPRLRLDAAAGKAAAEAVCSFAGAKAGPPGRAHRPAPPSRVRPVPPRPSRGSRCSGPSRGTAKRRRGKGASPRPPRPPPFVPGAPRRAAPRLAPAGLPRRSDARAGLARPPGAALAPRSPLRAAPSPAPLSPLGPGRSGGGPAGEEGAAAGPRRGRRALARAERPSSRGSPACVVAEGRHRLDGARGIDRSISQFLSRQVLRSPEIILGKARRGRPAARWRRPVTAKVRAPGRPERTGVKSQISHLEANRDTPFGVGDTQQLPFGHQRWLPFYKYDFRPPSSVGAQELRAYKAWLSLELKSSPGSA